MGGIMHGAMLPVAMRAYGTELLRCADPGQAEAATSA
jgi:hypothetical protein